MGLSIASRALAQDSGTTPNPLEVEIESDPLLPELVVDRPLSPQELRVFKAGVAELSQAGEAALAQGNTAEAFDIWIRELRLRRLLGPYEEVAALKRVGRIAWSERQTTEVRIINQRLLEIEIETQTNDPVDYQLLLEIADAYHALRSRQLAVDLYDTILTNARATDDASTEKQALVALADLHLSWFDYPNAAIAYEDLLVLSRTNGDKVAEVDALTQLAHIYTEGDQPQDAIAIRTELVNWYEKRQEFEQIPVLKIANGDDFVDLNRPDLAAPSYQEAFAVARSVQYFGYAAEALTKLAELYQSLDRPDDALVVYQLLIDVEQQSYNYYGLMTAYDLMGQLHQQRGASNQALLAYRQGLDIARQLDFRVNYFQTQVNQVQAPTIP
ncbi:MAG: tetratricopeptide repeat protein [Cyanobacteria bacterium P01_F01_bin.150]